MLYIWNVLVFLSHMGIGEDHTPPTI